MRKYGSLIAVIVIGSVLAVVMEGDLGMANNWNGIFGSKVDTFIILMVLGLILGYHGLTDDFE